MTTASKGDAHTTKRPDPPGDNNNMSGFAHLHVHSDYSKLDGLSKLEHLADVAARDGQTALAVTDHGNLHGAVDLVDACAKSGITPIVGLEAYLVDNTTKRAALKARYHQILLAVNQRGWRNLCRLSTRSYLQGMDSRNFPCVNFDDLAGHAEGLVATTSCLGGVVPQQVAAGDMTAARQTLGLLADIFGLGNLYIELQSHNIPEETAVNAGLVELADSMRLPLLATNDSHYTHAGDAEVHDALLCLQTDAKIDDTSRYRFAGDGYWLKTSAEMRQLFAERPDACDNTVTLAGRVHTDLGFRNPMLPSMADPGGMSEIAKLRAVTWKGAQSRYGDKLSSTVVERLRFELESFERMGYPGYVLLVADLCDYARQVGIPIGPGRGSAAGSAVLYCLGVTELDPIAYDLSFERFMNPHRKQMPDIDIDVDDRRRDELLTYLAHRYGAGNVAQISTYDTIQARNAIKDAARVLGYPYSLGERLCKMLPAVKMGRSVPLEACLNAAGGNPDGYQASDQLRNAISTDSKAHQVVDLARRLEGVRRGTGVHAGGVVVSDKPLQDVLALQTRPGGIKNKQGSAHLPVLQTDLHGAERFGLVKFDLLGLRTLGVIDAAITLARNAGVACPDASDIPLDDPDTYKLMAEGRTVGVFQFETAGIRQLLSAIKPTRLDDIVACSALYRPGPMGDDMHNKYVRRRHGREPVDVLHPDMAMLFADTYGLCIYQEQLLKLVVHYAGPRLNAADADDIRKACGKKDHHLLAAKRKLFSEGCQQNGHDEQLIRNLWELIEPFADYGFNRSHALAYAVLSARAAWLKAHIPAALWAAQMTSVTGDYDGLARYLAAARSEGVRILGTDINKSQVDFNIEDDNGALAVRFGLRSIRNLGEARAVAVIQERADSGPYTSLDDLIVRLSNKIGVSDVTTLIQAGALDCLGARDELVVYATAKHHAMHHINSHAGTGQQSLFGAQTMLDMVQAAPAETVNWLEAERDALGIYLSGHPLDEWDGHSERSTWIDAGQLPDVDDTPVFVRGAFGILHVNTATVSSRGTLVVKGMLYGKEGAIPIIAFAMTGEACREYDRSACLIQGRIENSPDRQLYVDAVIRPAHTARQ